MFKRITLALMLAFFAATTVTVNAANPFFNNRKSARIDQSSKDAVVKTLLFAVLDKDVDTIWKLMDPELRKQAEANGITKKDFAEFMLKEIDLDKMAQEMGMKRTDAVKLLKAFFNDDIDTIWALFPQAEKQGLIQQAGSEANAKAMFKQMLPEVRKEMTKQFEKECKLVKRNGKWYVSGDKMLNKSPKKPAVKKSAVKQSTKEEAAESFCTAVANGDGNTVWELVSPAEKREMIEEMGSEAAAKAAFAKEFSPDAEGQAMLKDPAQRSIFINMMKSAVDGNNAWVKSNGKWYINFGKLK